MNIQVIVKTLCLIFFSAQLVFAQQKERYENEDNQEQQEYDNEFTFGINWNTNGGLIGGIAAKYAWQHDKYQTQYHFIGLEMVHVTHPKEITEFGGLTNYILGKTANFFSIRPHFGREILLFNKGQEEGIQVSLMMAAGPSLGLWVPYYVYYSDKKQVSSISDLQSIPYDTSLASKGGYIYGSSGFFEGVGHITPYLGVHSKVSLNFEYGPSKSSVTGFEVGMMGELFTSEINIIPASQNGHSFFFSFFVTAYFGMR